jgi:hypothetical protein
MRAVREKSGVGLHFAILQQRRLKIADQVTGARHLALGRNDRESILL